MTLRKSLLFALALLQGCASMDAGDGEPYAERIRQAGDAYTTCVAREAEKGTNMAAGAEDIAIAAQGRCWSQWEAYRDIVRRGFTADASTPEEKQLAQDKAEAHLRQFERETRVTTMSGIVERTLTRKSDR